METLVSTGSHFTSWMKITVTSKPTPAPPSTIQRNESEACPRSNVPVTTAIKAKLNTIREDASLSMLSVSMMVDTLLGTFTYFIITLALTASVEDTMPPSRKPVESESPGISHTASNATDSAVRNTSKKEKLRITLHHCCISFTDTLIALS